VGPRERKGGKGKKGGERSEGRGEEGRGGSPGMPKSRVGKPRTLSYLALVNSLVIYG